MQNIYSSILNIIATCNNKSCRIRLHVSFGLQNIPFHNSNIFIR